MALIQSHSPATFRAGTIYLQSPLPALTRDQVTVLGRIALDGTTANGDGLDISGSQDSVQSMTIIRFSGDGLSITGNNDSVTASLITKNQSGIDVSEGATGNSIGGTATGVGNTITGNTIDGLVLDDAQNTLIQGNWIGTDSSGDSGLGNGADGIDIKDGASNNTIGLLFFADMTPPPSNNPTANTIAFNGKTGIVVTGDYRQKTLSGVIRSMAMARFLVVQMATVTILGSTSAATDGRKTSTRKILH